jgi:tRNA nucleotidyltransferase/poly(A) polymerase
MSTPQPPAAPEQGEQPSPYAGRWVARLRGQIVAHGGTPEQARRAAQSARHKEIPEIRFMPFEFSLPVDPILEKVREALPVGQIAYLVGGAVRDALLGRVSHDLDFAVPANAIAAAKRVANALDADFFVLDGERDTGRVLVTNPDSSRTLMDFAAYRGPDLEIDLRSRDFTINALALDVQTGELHDPTGGASDLRQKQIRACSTTTFTDDPVRVLRAVRQAASLGFHIQPETRQAMKAAVNELSRVSPERQRDEMFRILEGPQPATCLRALDMLGVLTVLLPELPAMKGVAQPPPHVSDVWTHTLSVLAHLEKILADLAPGYDANKTSDMFTGLLTLRLGRYRKHFARHFGERLVPDRSLRGLLFLAALYHDVSKPETLAEDDAGRLHFWGHDELGAQVAVRRMRAFNFSNDEIGRVQAVIRHHMRPHFHSNRMEAEGKPPSRRAIYRFFRDAGSAGVDTCLMSLADLRATREQTLTQESWAAALDVCRTFLENYFEKPEETVAPPVLVNGNDVILAYNLQPGPLIGQVLEAIREAGATGKVNNKDEALAFGKQWLAELKSQAQ